MTRRRLLVALLCVSAAAAGASPVAAQPPAGRALAGRPMVDVLRELQRRGLPLVFSSELVRDDMRVLAEPPRSGDRQLLDAILVPHRLEVRRGPGGTLLIVRARRPAPAAPPGPPAAASTSTVRGIVVDARTAAPLSGVRVWIAGGAGEAMTDGDGRFELPGVEAGDHTLAASLVGYALARPEVTAPAGGTADVAIALADGTGAYAEQITVTGDRFRGTELTVPSAMMLTSTDLLELRGVLTDDPLRAAQALPSVMTGSDHRSEFSVRGSDFRHIGLSVDGVAIGWPVHTVRDDLSGGSVALVNGDVVDTMTLSAGAYPQERPSATGAWLDLTIREGSRTAVQAHGAAGMTSASLVVEGPVGSAGRGSWLVSGRQSYLQWILARMDASSTRFGFSDAQGKFVYEVTPRQRLQVTFLAGRSLLEQDHADPEPNLVHRGSAHTTMLAAEWQSTVGASSAVNHTLAMSGHGFVNDSALAPVLADGSGRFLSYRGAVSHALRPGTVLRAGLHAERRSARQVSTRYLGFSSEADWLPRSEVVDGSRSQLASFGRITHTVRDRFALDGGVLVTHAPSPAASPWLAMRLPVGALTFRAGGGVYRQTPDLEQTIGSFGDPDLRPERSRQLEAAVEHAWRPGVRWQATVYQREERDVLRLDDNEFLVRDGKLVTPSPIPGWRNSLRGSSRGVELLVQRRSVSGLSGWLSYAWSRTDYEDPANGERFFADADQRHTVSAYGLYRLSPVTSINARFRYGSNFPLPGYFTRLDGDLHVGSARNTERLPAYARLDVRANRAFNFDTRRLTLFVELVNLFGRTNHAPDAPRIARTGHVRGATQRLFPFLPTAGVQIDF
jgi:hypothetical protein